MKLNIIHIISLALQLWLPISGSGAATGDTPADDHTGCL